MRKSNLDSSHVNMELGVTNTAFEAENGSSGLQNGASAHSPGQQGLASGNGGEKTASRDTWGNPVEFLLSCIAMSVGLGNVWRFPFTAYENGGGAFLLPYLVILLLIGKPLYFLEMALGQFSSYGSVKVWEVVPILKGVGYGQALATWFVVTYYCALIAITVFYFFSSFQSVLPWTVCDSEWSNASCYSSVSTRLELNSSVVQSSSEQYFLRNVLHKFSDIDDGIGAPDWRLSMCLLFSWVVICLILVKGVASSGKVAYFTALFPYTVLITLLIRGATLEGATEGIMFFITPSWDKLLDIKTWYAAVTQCFFSLSVGFGPIIMYSSYNPFRHNIYRDAIIISFMDTFTSFLAGITIFSILGNLAHETNKTVDQVVQGGTGLAFISYPEAIAKFDAIPQLFAVLFFLMLFTLGVGSAVSLTGCVITIICDDFPTWKRWIVTVAVCAIGFIAGLVYVTPGGMFILDVVDYFGGGFIIFVMAMVETIGICWIYGTKRFIRDVEFMLGVKLSAYWAVTWAVIIPILLKIIFWYAVGTYKPLGEGNYEYPASATGSGWLLTAIALLQLPIWAIVVVYNQKQGSSLWERFKNCLLPTDEWGPKDSELRLKWINFSNEHTGSNHWSPSCPKISAWAAPFLRRMRYDVSAVAHPNLNHSASQSSMANVISNEPM